MGSGLVGGGGGGGGGGVGGDCYATLVHQTLVAVRDSWVFVSILMRLSLLRETPPPPLPPGAKSGI